MISYLSYLLDTMAGAPVRLERNGVVCRKETDHGIEHDPVRVREGFGGYVRSQNPEN